MKGAPEEVQEMDVANQLIPRIYEPNGSVMFGDHELRSFEETCGWMGLDGVIMELFLGVVRHCEIQE